MELKPPRIVPLSESSLVVEFGNEISLELNSFAIALADRLGANPFPGFVEAFPAYASTAVYFDPIAVRCLAERGLSAFDRVAAYVKAALSTLDLQERSERNIVEIPTDFSISVGLDLPFVAESHGRSTSEVISIFTAKVYRVFMIGFLPGFAYMGEVDERIRTARHQQPRTNVPRGSVGIAGVQTGVYPMESPGGWQIIGKTSDELFVPNADPPSRLQPGDRVRFVAI